MKSLLRFLFIWLGVWGAPFFFFPHLESTPTLKKIFFSPEYILGIGFLILVGFFIEDHRRRKKHARDALRCRQASGRQCVPDVHAEPGAERTGQALIVVYGPMTPYGGSFQVWIDGEWDGEIRPCLANEFDVEPGEHTVAVSMGWFRSRPVPVTARPGTRNELKIGGPSRVIFLKLFLPILVCGVVAALIVGGLEWAGAFARPTPQWFVAISVAVFAGYFVPASLLIRDYWAIYALKPVNASAAQRGEPEPAASADRPRA